MRIIAMCFLLCLPVLIKGQKLALGGYITPTYGNIVFKSQYYKPIFTIGGGLVVNYYKKRWNFSTGLNLKNVGGSQEIPITTVAQPEGTGEYAHTIRSIKLLTVPLGVYYSIISKDNFKLHFGINIENGKIINDVIKADIINTSQKGSFYHNQKYYLGIMPKIGFDCNITQRKYLFLNIGYTYQCYQFLDNKPTPFEPQGYKINNLFIDIGFGYRLKN